MNVSTRTTASTYANYRGTNNYSGVKNFIQGPARFMRWLFVFMMVIGAALGLQAQSINSASYPMTYTTGVALEDLSTGATQTIAGYTDDGSSLTAINMPFSFLYVGSFYTSLYANANGYVRLGATPGSISWTNSLNSSDQSPAIAPYWDDITVGTNGEVRYKTVGTAPNRKFVVEWKNMTIPRVTSAPGAATFQLWLFEGTNTIQFVYGSGIVTSTDGYSIGLNKGIGNFASITQSTNSVSYSTAKDNNTDAIASGSSYIFTPAASIAGPSSLSFSNIGIESMTLNWVAASPTDGIYGYVILASSDGGTTYQPMGIVNDAATTTANITGLTGGTTYLWQVYAYAEGNLSSSYADNVQATGSCSLTGTFSIGPSGDYASLTAALTNLGLQGANGSIIYELAGDYTSSGETFPIKLGHIPCMNATNTVTIRPAAGATGLSITGSNTTALFSFDGGSHFIIDGRPGGSGTASLSISNSGNGPAIRYINAANNNTVQYTSLSAASTGTSGGVITFSTGGNNNNTISNCDVNGGGVAANLLYSSGSSGNANTGNIISNNNFHDQFDAGSATRGLNIGSNNQAWTITGNSFYQTAARTYTSGNAHYAIYIFSGDGYTITNNFIGGNQPGAGGTAMTLNGSATTTFGGIYLNGSNNNNISTVTGNTISKISLTSNSTSSSGAGVFSGIYSTAVSGNINNNTVSSITIVSGANAGISGGIIASFSGTPNSTINNNSISGINISGSSTAYGSSFYGIWSTGGPTGSVTINGNTIGHATNANSIWFSSATTGTSGGILYGIYNSGNPTGGIAITNNTIANLTTAYAPSTAKTTSILNGIYVSSGVYSVANNSIHDLSANANATGSGSGASVAGINITATTTGSSAVSQNSIYSLANNHATSANYVTGIYWGGNAASKANRNLIYSLYSPSILGMVNGIQAGASGTIENNMIRLGIDASGASRTTATAYNGIYSTSAANIYHNTVYIGGTGVNTTPATATYAFNSTVTTGTRAVMNNIFINTRSSASAGANHYAIRLAGITGLTINANDYFANGAFAGVLGSNNGTDVTSLTAWKTFTAQDAKSISTDVCLVNPNAGTPDLHLTDCSGAGNPADGLGVMVSTTDDFDGDDRSALSPVDLGADAGSYGLEGINVGLSALNTPVSGGCYTNAEAVEVQLNNYDANDIDFSVNPVTITVTNNHGYTSTVSINTGTLAGGASMPVALPDDMDLTVNGVYAINGTATATGDVNPANDAFTTVNMTVNQLGGTYTVGTGGNYATIKDAVAAYNTAACLTGAVVFSLTDASYGSETFPITINNRADASATNTLTIRPASGNTVTLSGSNSTAIFNLNGADYVTLDGSNNGSDSRDWSITNTYSSGGAVVSVTSATGTGNDAHNVTISNLNLTAGTNTASAYGIFSTVSGNNVTTNYLTIQNNNIQKAYYGVYITGSGGSSNPHTNLLISRNSIGSDIPGNYVIYYGIYLYGATNPVVSHNRIFNMIQSGARNNAGINMDYVTGGSIDANSIENVHSTSTSGYGAYGINFGGSSSNGITISNNMISGIMTANYSSSSTTYNAFGIRLYGNSNIKIYHNSINMFGDVTSGSSMGMSANICLYYYSTTDLDIQNNILVNTQNFGTNGSSAYNIYSDVANSSFATLNNNLYFGTTGTSTTWMVAKTSTSTYNTLADWQTATSLDANSFSVAPTFTGNNDLHLVPLPNAAIDNRGTDVGIAADFDGDARSATKPDVGADEFDAPLVSDVSLSGMVEPGNSGCYSTTENVKVTIKNNMPADLDMSVTPVTITVTEAGGYTSTITVNSGVLPALGTLDVNMPDPIDMSAAGTYTFNGSASALDDAVVSNDAMQPVAYTSTTPSVGTLSSSPESFCITGGTPTLTLSDAAGGNIQWQESTTSDSGPWTDVGTNSLTYTPSTDISGTTYYQVIVGCAASGLSATSTVVTVLVNNPQITSTTNDDRCGEGSVTLQAAANAGSSIEWYDAATGGNKVGTGTSFTTPVINTTTTYYATAYTGSLKVADIGAGANTTVSTGSSHDHISPFDHYWGSSRRQYLFLASELQAAGFTGGMITDIAFDVAADAGSSYAGFAVSIGTTAANSLSSMQSGLNTVYTNVSEVTTLGLNTYHFTAPFAWDGTSNIVLQVCWGNSNTGGTGSKVKYDNVDFNASYYFEGDNIDGATACSATSATITGGVQKRPKVTFTANGSCYSDRIAVTATINTPPAITATVTDDVLCAGESTQVDVTSPNDPNYTYEWTPGNLAGASQTLTPASTTTYTVTATDNSGGVSDGCVTSADITVTVNPAVTGVTASATPQVVCAGGTTNLSANANSGEFTPVTYTEDFENGLPSDWAILNPGSGYAWEILDYWDDYPFGDSHSGDKVAEFQYNTYNSANTWMITKGFNLTANVPVNISFWEMTGGYNEKLKVTVGQTQTVAGQSTVLVDYGAHQVTSYTQRTVSFTPTTSGTYYFGFNAYSDADEYFIDIDDISISYSAPTSASYSWTSDVGGFTSTDQNPTGVAPTQATTYTVTATNSFGCSAQATVNVTISDLAVSATASDVLCNGGSTGSVTATATGGISPYEYSIDGTNWQESNVFSDLAAGDYTVQVRDANSVSCTVSSAIVTVAEPDALQVSIGGSLDPACWLTATGSITATATGGVGSYTYSIDGPTVNMTGASTGAFTDLAAGTYTITVTDANSCQAISTQVTLTDPAAPSVTAGNNGPVCAGSDVTLTATSGYVTYVWTGPGTINDNDQATATGVTPTDGAEYTVSITDANGCTNTATTTVSVVDNAPVEVNIAVSPGEEICSGTEVTFTATPVNGGATPSYKWFVNDVEQVGETNNTFVTSSINDQDYVYCEVTSSITCTSGNPATSNTITMTVSGLIFADVSLATDADNNTVCDGTSITLTATANGAGGEPVYDFYVNYNLAQSGSSNTYTYTPQNGDEVYVDMTSSFSCAVGSPATSNSETITVNPIPAAPEVTVGGATTFCNGGSVTLTSNYNTDNLWSTDERTNEITVTTSGIYTVTYTELGCTSPASEPVEVIVNENPTATVTGPASVCTGSSISLSAETSTAGSGTIESYQWILDGTTNLGTDATQEVTAEGSYTVTITNSNGCTVTSEAFVVSENTPPVASVSASCTTLAPEQTAVLTATPATGVTYSWTLDGGAELSTANPFTTAPNAGGTYMVTVTDANGCTGTATQEISGMTGALVGGTTYDIPSACGGFPTIASVVSYLNTNGVTGTGDVTIAVAAGYSETAPASGYVLTASGTASNQIKFVVDGAGTATINAGVGTNTPATNVIDAMFKIVGGDYITIDGFTFTDGNTSNPATMEAGVAMLKADGTNGSQYNTISNNTFNMQRVNNVSGTFTRGLGAVGVGIYNTDNTLSTDVVVTSAGGSNSYNKVYGNSFNGGNGGVAVIGYDGDASPYALADHGNDIGGSSAETGNTVLNFGDAGTGDVLGIMSYAQYDLNISYNTINNNDGNGVNHPGYLNGIYIDEATGANSDITHNNITMTNAVTTKQLSGIFNLSGASGGIVNITDNAVTLVNNATGTCNSVGYYNGNAVSTLHMDNNTVSLSTTAPGGSNFGYYNAGSVSTALTMDGNAITGQTYSTAGSSAFYGFYVPTLSGTGSISNNSITGVSHTGAQTGSWYFVYKTASGTTETINGNSINNVTIGTTSGTPYLFYVSNSNTGTEIANNTVNGFTKAGAGSAFYGIYNFGGPTNASNIHDNNFSNISVNTTGSITLGSSGGAQLVFWATGASNTINIYNNTVSNFTQTGTGDVVVFATNYGVGNVYGNTINTVTASGSVYARVNGSSSHETSTYNNTITGLSSTGTSGKAYAVYIGNGSYAHTIYGNTISGITSSATSSPAVGGIYLGAGTTNAIYKNKIHSLSATGAFTTGTGMVSGITVAGGSTNNVYNNFIGNLTAPAGSSTDAVRGINLSGGTTQNISFNTVYLNASSTGANFGSSALYASTSPTVNLRSNILVNNSTAGGTGLTVVYRRSATSLTSYGSVSNKNLFYAGTPSATNLIFNNGTNSDQTLADYKTRVTPRDADSKTENPTFLSTTAGDADYLHIDPTVETQIESGGMSVAGVTDDYDGDIRFGQTGYTGSSVVGPDMGADEFDGIAPACSGALGGTASISTSSLCFGNTNANVSVSGASSGAGIIYQWMVSSTAGGPYSNVVGGSGANTASYITPADLAVGTYYYVLQVTCTSGEGETHNSTEVSLTVKPVPTATAAGADMVCSGTNLSLTGTTDIGTSFAWTGPGGFNSTSQNPVRTNVGTSAAGDYTFTASANGCTSTPSTISVEVNETPGAVAVSPATAILCEGATQELTATGGTLNQSLALYSENFNAATNNWTIVNGSTSPTNGNWRLRADGSNSMHSPDNSQIMSTDANATSSGQTTESSLISPALSTIGLSAANIEFDQYYYKYSSDVSAAVQLSTDATNWTTLVDYTPTGTQGSASSFNHAVLAVPAQFLNEASVYVRFYYKSVWGFYWGIDNVSLTTPISTSMVWSPATDLYLDEEATQPYAGEDVHTVYVKSNSSVTVTATATNNGCSSAASANLVINPAPEGNMESGSVAVCQNSDEPTITFTGTMGTAPYTFTYTINGGTPQTAVTNAGANPQSVTISVPTNAGGTFTYAVTNVADIYCSAEISGTYDVTVNALPVVSFSGLPSTVCEGSGTYTLTPSPEGGTFSGTGVTGSVFDAAVAGVGGPYTISYTYFDGTCSNTYTQDVTVTALPVVSIVGLAANYCTTDAAVTLTGSPAGGTFSGTGVSGNSFDPSVAGEGTFTITYNYTDENGCSGSSTQDVEVTVCPTYTQLNLKLFIEGFYQGNNTMATPLHDFGGNADATATDEITVNLWSAANLSGSTPDYTANVILHNDGTASVQFPAAVAGNSYYIAIKTRNALETWSANAVAFTASTSYDFTSGLSQAYDDGVNAPMANMGNGVYAIYSGDVNQDGTIDSQDANQVEVATNDFAFGFDVTDINGDGSSDGLDANMVETNLNLFLFFARPY